MFVCFGDQFLVLVILRILVKTQAAAVEMSPPLMTPRQRFKRNLIHDTLRHYLFSIKGRYLEIVKP